MAKSATTPVRAESVTIAAKIDAQLAAFIDDKRFELRIDKKSDLIRDALESWAASQGFVRTVAE